jgi:hypothetical protein
MENDIIKTTQGKTLKRIDRNCKVGDNVFYVYTHSNGNQYWTRIIKATFIRYAKKRDIVIIQREDTRNRTPTRTNILKVYMELK